MSTVPSIVWFADLDTQSEHFGKHSKHFAKLTQAKFPLIPGFVVTTTAYRNFLSENHLEEKIRQLLGTLALDRADSLMQGEHHIKQLFEKAKLSESFTDELLDFYDQLGDAITLEIFETGNLGKKHKKLHVDTAEALSKEVVNLWAQMFAGHALWRRHQEHHNHFTTGAEIVIRKIIQGDKSGSVFTLDPATHEKDKLVIITAHPHGGDSYILSKKNLTILERDLKHIMRSDKLTLDEIFAIAKMAKRIGEHLYWPQEISWIIKENKLYLVENKQVTEFPKQKSERKSKLPVARGKGVSARIGTGVVSIIHVSEKLPKINSHDVLVMAEIKPQQLQKIKKVSGIVIEKSLHAEIAALLRQHGIPAICNVKNATKNFHNGQLITIHAEKGEIYLGGLL